MNPETFATRAEALVGAPFRLGGRDPASGLDCVGLIACALGGVDAPTGYGLRNSAIHRHLAFAKRAGFLPAGGLFARGDLTLAQPGAAQHHLLVALGPDRFVHAHAGLGRVVVLDGEIPWPVLRHWRFAEAGA
ncbi:peptidoglycan endopeptidase [Qipengyuania sp.]|uniref:peptidoglycan endopeptidase n=1 Tax=Qipengyuania sp. TaxID=2004515 RepID=UPI0035C7CAB5